MHKNTEKLTLAACWQAGGENWEEKIKFCASFYCLTTSTHYHQQLKQPEAESWSKKSLKSANLKYQTVSLHFNMGIPLQNLPKETLKNCPNIRKPSESKACLILRRMPWRLDRPGVSMQNASDPASTLRNFCLALITNQKDQRKQRPLPLISCFTLLCLIVTGFSLFFSSADKRKDHLCLIYP